MKCHIQGTPPEDGVRPVVARLEAGGSLSESWAHEPIHLVGQIQPHGLLLALSEPDFIVRQVSANVEAFLGMSADGILGRSIESVLGTRQFAAFRSMTDNLLAESPVLRGPAGERALEMECVAHRCDGMLIAEFEPVALEPDAAAVAREALKFFDVQRLFTRIERASDACDVSRVAAAEMRRLSGFDHTLVYRFDDEWNGEVIGESMAPGAVSYLGLRFPAADLPAQARGLLFTNRVRSIADVDSIPVPIVPEIGPHTGRALDLSRAFLRGASAVHVAYLRNMGVRSSLTLSILVDDRLWGMLTCFGYDALRPIDHATRTVCEVIARNLSLQMALRVYQDAWRSRLTAEQRREAYVARLEASSGRFDAQPFQREQLLELMDADGLIARIGGAVSSQGVTEPEESLQPVIAALRSVASRGIASSDALRDLDDSAASYASRVSGALYIGLSESTGEYLLLSRRELPATVRWAGNYDPAPDAQGDCNPQASFVAWRKNMRGRARPWTDIELETARMVRKQFLHVRDAQKLRRLEDRFRYASTR